MQLISGSIFTGLSTCDFRRKWTMRMNRESGPWKLPSFRSGQTGFGYHFYLRFCHTVFPNEKKKAAIPSHRSSRHTSIYSCIHNHTLSP